MACLTTSIKRFLTLCVFCLLSATTFATPKPAHSQDAAGRSKKGHVGRRGAKYYQNGTVSCATQAILAKPAPYVNVWGGLTDFEAASTVEWLLRQADLNLTVSESSSEWDNSVLLVELMIPNKTDVLVYIDNSGAAPARYAHVVLDVRATPDPHYADILVGPLPIKNGTTTWVPLEYSYTRKTQGRVRNLDADSLQNRAFLKKVGADVQDITLGLWGMTSVGDNATMQILAVDPVNQEDGKITVWHQFVKNSAEGWDTGSIMPSGLYFVADLTGRDSSKWGLKGWLYNNIFYSTTSELRAAFRAPGFEKLPLNYDGEWDSVDHQEPTPPQDTRTPPIAIAPGGDRYSVDIQQKYIRWMDFSFYVGFSRDTGMTLYDIKYKGERVLYELGLQEALAHYAGNDPIQSGTAYLDSFYGFGPYAFELVPGYDCPGYATYLNSSFYVSETTHTHVNSICLFEFDADYPMARHSTSENVMVSKNIYFTIRSVSTVGNYDYMFSYSFYMDGSINVEVRASGYIQAAFFANNEEYGFQIHNALSGSMHDHVLNIKADFDIAGTANTVRKISNVATKEVYPWSFNKTRSTMKLARSDITNEDHSRFNWADNGLTQVVVSNKDAVNKFGEPRGYRIAPLSGTAHLTVEDSSNLINAANWANHDIQVTRQHDTEPRAAHALNSQDVANPVINFDDFFNSESLEQEDLVMWFNLGMHHVPHTGDLPNTVFTAAHSGIQFTPHNYLLGDPSKESVNMVRLSYNGGSATVNKFRQGTGDLCLLAYESPVLDLEDYTGDVVIRKYPFNPNEPFYETDSIS